MKKNSLKKIMEANYKEFKTWPEWKQNIEISAEAARTGIFIKEKKKTKDCDYYRKHLQKGYCVDPTYSAVEDTQCNGDQKRCQSTWRHG